MKRTGLVSELLEIYKLSLGMFRVILLKAEVAVQYFKKRENINIFHKWYRTEDHEQ